MSLADTFKKLFSSHSKQLTWSRVADTDRDLGPELQKDGGYYSVRVARMFVKDARVLWRKYLPMVNGVVTQGATELNAVVGPAQIKQFGDIDLSNMIVLNQPLTGAIVYTEEDFGVTVGLLSVTARDFGQALLDTAASVSSLMQVDLGVTAKLAPVLKGTVENLLGAQDVRLEVGIMERYSTPGNPLKPGVHVGIAASQGTFRKEHLRYVGDQLMIGADRRSMKPFDSYDYMVLLIESRTKRPDWASLPEFAGFEVKFSSALAAATHDARKEALQPALKEFINAATASKSLAKPDREFLPNHVKENLQKRLDLLNTGGLELKSTRKVSKPVAPAEFDFLDMELERPR